jgi:hypothetical protein
MIETFSLLLQRATLEKVRGSLYFSILVDESMDTSKAENLIIYVRYFEADKAKTVNEYACTRKLTRCNTQGIFDTVNAFMLESYRKLLCLGSDGASVMLGSRNSLLQSLKAKNPFITNTHCTNHRLALASSQLIDQLPYLLEDVELMSDIHNFFSRSASRNQLLKENQINMDEDELRMVRICPHTLVVTAQLY